MMCFYLIAEIITQAFYGNQRMEMKKLLKDTKVLIVDDDAIFLDAISTSLTMHGANVHSASNGIEAMELLKKTQVHFILSDMRMPESDGMDFLKNLRVADPNPPPFFFLTGYAAQYSIEEMKELGATGILAKPISLAALIETIAASIKP